VARLDALIAAQTALGVTGLRLGVVYEARAEVALWAGDPAAFANFASLTAREYRHGSGCPLSARYERLTNEARRRGIQSSVTLDDFASTHVAQTDEAWSSDLAGAVRTTLSGANDWGGVGGRRRIDITAGIISIGHVEALGSNPATSLFQINLGDNTTGSDTLDFDVGGFVVHARLESRGPICRAPWSLRPTSMRSWFAMTSEHSEGMALPGSR